MVVDWPRTKMIFCIGENGMIKKIGGLFIVFFLLSCTGQAESVNAVGNDEYQQIMTQYILGNYSEVLTLLKHIKTKDEKENQGINYLYGLCYMHENMNSLARTYYFKVLDKYPDNYEILNNIGVAYYQDSDFINAMKYFHLSYITNMNYTIARDNYNIAYLNYYNNSPPEMQGLMPFADEVINYNSLGWFYYYLGDLVNSVYYFRKAVESDDKYQFAYISLGYIYDENKNYIKALDYLEKAEAIDPDNPDLQNNLGVLYFHLGRPEDSEASFLRAIELNAFFAEPYNNLGFLYYTEKDYLKSREYLFRGIELNDYNPDLLAESYSLLALIAMQERDPESAAEYKAEAVRSSYRINDIVFLEEGLQWSGEMISLWEDIQ